MQLLRLLGEDPVEEPQPHPHRRNRNTARAGGGARRHINPPPAASGHALTNSTGTQNLEGLINNTGYVQGNGNGSIIMGGFDSSTNTFN